MRIGAFALFLIFVSCHVETDNKFEIQTKGKEHVSVALVKEGKVNIIQCALNDSVTSRWRLNFPVYKFIKGDINNDGQDDIAVGVIKPTLRDSVARKRIFLFQIRNNAIIPLWLGSSLSRPLEDFQVHTQDSVTLIRSIEKEITDRYLVGEYQWFGFGLSFQKYLLREVTLKEARDFLEND